VYFVIRFHLCLLSDRQKASVYATVLGTKRRAIILSEGDLPVPAKILIVDDQQFVRQTLCALLMQRSHWTIYEAADGRAAIDRAREVKPDVAVIDLVMPKMNGLAAAYELRRLSPETKIIFMSSHYVKEEAAHLARLLGDGSFIPKSEIGKELISTISGLLPEESQAR
jgi:DNA-binding NarL/FixJ family response regulator